MDLDFVWLDAKRYRGWPWPEGNAGFEYISVLYGEHGWCRGCGMPFNDQTGPLQLQRAGLTVRGAWQPYWVSDLLCLDEQLARRLAPKYSLILRDIAWPKPNAERAYQVQIPVVGVPWFDEIALSEGIRRRGGKSEGAGTVCSDCRRWRWFGCRREDLPPLLRQKAWSQFAIVASPEQFGSGWQVFREVLCRRDLAEELVAVSPRDFEVREVRWAE